MTVPLWSPSSELSSVCPACAHGFVRIVIALASIESLNFKYLANEVNGCHCKNFLSKPSAAHWCLSHQVGLTGCVSL